jgi:hypothetical protein
VKLFGQKNESENKIAIWKLQINSPKPLKDIYSIDQELAIGSDEKCSLYIVDQDLSPLHIKLKIQNEILSLIQMGPNDSTKIGKQSLKHGKMYILDTGDKIQLGKIKAEIKQEFQTISVDHDETVLHDTAAGILREQEEPSDDFSQVDIKEYDIVEEEVYFVTDEDGKTQKQLNLKKDKLFSKKEKGPSFFSKLFKKKKSSKAMLKPKGLKKHSDYGSPPWIFARLMSLAVAMALTFLITEFGLKNNGPLKPLDKTIKQTQAKTLPILKKAIHLSEKNIPFIDKKHFINISRSIDKKDQFNTWFTFLFIFILQDFFFHLLLGTNLPLFIMGVKGNSSFIVNRIKAIIRVLLSYITFPFLIFEIPILLKKRPFREVLSFSHLEYRSKYLSFLGFFIFSPLILLATSVGPFLFEYEELMNHIAISKITPRKKIKAPKESINYSATSNFFGLKFESKINPHWRILPTIDRSPKIIIFNTKRKKEAILSLEIPPYNPKTFSSLIKKDPLLSSKDSPWSAQFKGKVSLEKKEEILIDLLIHLYSLSWDNIHNFIKDRSPLLFYYFDLFKELRLNKEIQSIDHIALRGKTILSLHHSPKNVSLLHLGPKGVQKIQLSAKDRKIKNKVLNQVFFSAKPLKPFEKVNLLKVTEWNAFHVFDLFNELFQNGTFLENSSTPLYKFFLKEAKRAYTEDDQNYQNLLISNIKKMDKYLLQFVARKKNLPKEITDLRLSLNRIQLALEKKEVKFFEIN